MKRALVAVLIATSLIALGLAVSETVATQTEQVIHEYSIGDRAEYNVTHTFENKTGAHERTGTMVLSWQPMETIRFADGSRMKVNVFSHHLRFDGEDSWEQNKFFVNEGKAIGFEGNFEQVESGEGPAGIPLISSEFKIQYRAVGHQFVPCGMVWHLQKTVQFDHCFHQGEHNLTLSRTESGWIGTSRPNHFDAKATSTVYLNNTASHQYVLDGHLSYEKSPRLGSDAKSGSYRWELSELQIGSESLGTGVRQNNDLLPVEPITSTGPKHSERLQFDPTEAYNFFSERSGASAPQLQSISRWDINSDLETDPVIDWRMASSNGIRASFEESKPTIPLLPRFQMQDHGSVPKNTPSPSPSIDTVLDFFEEQFGETILDDEAPIIYRWEAGCGDCPFQNSISMMSPAGGFVGYATNDYGIGTLTWRENHWSGLYATVETEPAPLASTAPRYKAPAEEGKPLALQAATGGVGIAAGLLYFLKPAIVSLFSREQTTPLAHPTRAKIMATLQSTPGIHFQALRRSTELAVGTTHHHLRVLERHKQVCSAKIGGKTFYYPGAKISKQDQTLLAAKQDARGHAILALLTEGEKTMSEIASFLQVAPSTANHHVAKLVDLHLVQVRTHGRRRIVSAPNQQN